MNTVEAYIQKHNAPEYPEAMLLFIKEENWHSAYLKKFMEYHHIKPAGSFFLDKVFRKLRQAGGYSFVRFIRENLGYLRQSIILAEKTL